MASETDKLIDRIKQAGYSVVKASEGHNRVIDRQGQVVRLENGQPFHFAATPSDSHAVANTEATLRKLGVLPAKNGDGSKLRRDVLVARSDQLRREVQELMDERGYKQADIYHFADKWAAEHGIGVPSFSQGVMNKFFHGGNLSNASYPWLSAAMSAIRRNNGIIPSMEHPARKIDEPAEIVPEKIGVQVEGESTTKIVKIPTLALDALQMIYKEEKDHDAIMALVQDIAKLEMK